MTRNSFILGLFLSFGLALSFSPILVSAQATEYKLLAPIPLSTPSGQPNETANTATYLPGLFRLMIAVATGVAVLRLIYAGIKYMSTDSFSQTEEAKGIISETLWGLLLAMSAWLIINTINPKLLDFNLEIARTTQSTTVSSTGAGAGGTSALTHNEVRAQFDNAGITFQGNPPLNGLQQAVIDEVVNLKNACGADCVVQVNSAVAGSHALGSDPSTACSHGRGWKIDLDDTPSLNTYLLANLTNLNERRSSDNAQLYRSSSGATYARESGHWDIQVPCN